MKDGFQIDVDDLSWIDGKKDDAKDLCLHGHVVVMIGKNILEYDATVSATALYLLKTLTKDHIISKEIQMLPCCGHFLVPNEDLSEVEIIGCDHGIDWSVIHDNDFVKLILDNGEESIVDLEEYKAEVLKFADKIEDFYNSCSSKILPSDQFERDGYLAFWNEWHRRK